MILSSAILEINLKNLLKNYKYLSTLNKNHLTGATIKADAYGLGDKKIIKTLYKAGCKHFFVATLSEALKLRKNFKYGYLYILNGIKKNQYRYIDKKNIIPIINSIQDLMIYKSIKNKIKVGIHIDTGINRLGISKYELNKYSFKDYNDIFLFMSHFASADEKNNFYNKKQSNIFRKIGDKYFNKSIKSMNNSTSLLLDKKHKYKLSRPGISIYGGHNKTLLKRNIKPVVKLKAEILQIKDIKKNEYVGYNQTYKSKKNMTIAIIGIGYADGISRSLSNKGYVYFKKNKFKIIGRISMDSITIDVTKKSKILKTGMFLELINYTYDIEQMANICGTISNEILTSISNRVERIYIN